MDKELDCYVDIDGERIPVSVSYQCEDDGYKPLLVGFFTHDDRDITVSVPENEFDRVYALLCDKVAENIACEQEQTLEYFNRYIAGDR